MRSKSSRSTTILGVGAVTLGVLGAWLWPDRVANGQESARVTYVVDQNHPQASDANLGTGEKPGKAIGQAAKNVQPGDTVYVTESKYDELAALAASATAERPVVFVSAPKHGAVMKEVVIAESAKHIRVHGFQVTSDKRQVGAESATTCTLISPQDEAPVIVIGADCTESEKYAAQELAEHLNKITGRDLKIIDESADAPAGRKIIAVGKSKLTEGYDIAALGVEQYIIDVTPERLVIVGGRKEPKVRSDGVTFVDDRGTLYGVYEFLEDLGVRWYRPEEWGTHVSRMDRIERPIGRCTSQPPDYVLRTISLPERFPQHRGNALKLWLENRSSSMPGYREAYERWTVRQRLGRWDGGSNRGEDPRFGGQARYQFNHAYMQLFPYEQYFHKHPDYYAWRDGKRDDGLGKSYRTGKLCLGNSKLQEAFAEKIVAQAKAHPEWDTISAEPSDGGTDWCECQLCKAMDDPKHANIMTNRVCAFNNMIARKLAEAVPGAKLQWLAYSNNTYVPTIVDRLEPNAIIMPAPINEWSDHSKRLHDPQNAAFLEVLQGWHRLKPSGIMIWEYWTGYGWPGPVPQTRAIADRLKHYRRYNVRGIFNDTTIQWGPQALELYMLGKLLWDPGLDLRRELDLYYHNYYGPAAEPMRTYHEAFMDEFEKYEVRSGGRGMHHLMKRPFIEKLGQYISSAQALVKGDSLSERRLAGVVAGYEFSRRVCDIMEFKRAKQEARADDAFYDLMVFLTGFHKGDMILDIDREDITRDANKFRTIPLLYLVGDLGVKWKGRPSNFVAPEDEK